MTESVTPGWSLTNLVCTGGGADSSTSVANRVATLDIDAGETVVCTFTNTKGASLTVVKVTDPASDPQDFDFDLNWGAACRSGSRSGHGPGQRRTAVRADLPHTAVAARRPTG